MTAVEQITDYLAKQDDAVTVTEIADATGVKLATVERNIRKLRDDSTIVEAGVADGNKKTWKLASAPAFATDGDVAITDAHDNIDELGDTPAGWGVIEAGTEAVEPEPLTDDQEAEMYRLGLTEDEYRARPEPEQITTTTERQTDDEWEASARPEPKEHDTVSTDTVETTEATAADKPRAEQQFFHKRGQLVDELLEFFAANPNETYTPHTIHKTGMSGTGSIAYTCEALVAKGKLNRTNDKPKTYGYKPESEWPVVEPKETKAQAKAREKAEAKAAKEAADAAAE